MVLIPQKFNLRKQVEKDLSFSLEGMWALPVELIDDTGTTYNTSANSPDPLNPLPLEGQVLLDTRGSDPDTGMPIVIGEPNVSLRISSLDRVPVAGERWAVRIPVVPDPDAALVTFLMSEVRPPEIGGSIGFIKLFLQKAAQA